MFFAGTKHQSAGAVNKNLPGGSRVCRSPKRKRGERRTDGEPFVLRFQGVRASAQSAKRVARADGADMCGLHFGCWGLARALRVVQVVGIGLGVVRGQ